VPRFAALLALAVMAMLAGSAGGALRTAQPGSDVHGQMSPDGRWLLFERYYGGSRYTAPDTSLRIAHADGSEDRELVPRTRALRAIWTPDNLVQVTLPDAATVLRRPDDGSVVRTMPVAPVAWSPDGRWIAYLDNNGRDLYVSAPDGSDKRLLASVPERHFVSVGAFSPDSTRLTYSLYGGLEGPDRSEVVRLDGTGRHLLKEASSVAPGTWSPAGDAVVLNLQNDSAGHYRPPRVYVVNADGSNAHPLAPGFATAPDWSPLGDWIVYLRQRNTRREDIYELMIARPDGSDRHVVVHTDGAGGTWLADGRHVLSVGSGGCRRYGILEIDVFARTVKRLTNRCSIVGTSGNDILRGTPLRDLVDGRGGNDTVVGGGGNDRLAGGSGNDTIRSRDRYRDTVLCGPGRDLVVTDYRDQVGRDCEVVTR
jgi:Tol biopolymer transport system component